MKTVSSVTEGLKIVIAFNPGNSNCVQFDAWQHEGQEPSGEWSITCFDGNDISASSRNQPTFEAAFSEIRAKLSPKVLAEVTA